MDKSVDSFHFGSFSLHLNEATLTRSGQLVRLTPKEFDTLRVLAEARGRVVKGEELVERVWPDSFVSDGSLARNISVLRKVLGKGVIETIPRRGYRLTLPVTSGSKPIEVPALQPVDACDSRPAEISDLGIGAPWKRPAFGLLIGTVLLIIIAAFHYSPVRIAKAHTSTASTQRIDSILIQKDGAIDPLDEGFKLKRPDGTYPHALYNRESNGWDRWRLVTHDQNMYSRPLSEQEKEFALQRNWTLTCVCAVETGGAFADIDFAGKGPRFDIELLQEDNRYFVALTKQISPKIELNEKIEFAGVADIAHPHTYELRYDQVSKAASLWIDGKLTASGYRGHYQFQEDLGLLFGVAVYGNATQSSAVFRTVRFEVN